MNDASSTPPLSPPPSSPSVAPPAAKPAAPIRLRARMRHAEAVVADAQAHSALRGVIRTRVLLALAWMERHHYLLAVVSFGIGVGSYILVDRAESFARWIGLLLVVGWGALLLESTFGEAFTQKHRWARFSPWVLRYATQNLHQETFFFCLPFIVATTTWRSGQALFTSLAIVGALCSMWDPIYYGVIARRPWLMLAFHAAAMYLAALVLPPLLWQLDTTWSLAIASATISTLSIPSLLRVVRPRRRWGWAMLAVMALALGGASWLIRHWVPPATLRTTRAQMTTHVNAEQREPDDAIETLSAEQLNAQGLCAFMAIRAPRGLHEAVFHRWIFDGKEQMSIPLSISGGSDKGYRFWSCKHNFPADPRGHWRVEAVTDTGQLIGLVRFKVEDAAPPAPAPANS